MHTTISTEKKRGWGSLVNRMKKKNIDKRFGKLCKKLGPIEWTLLVFNSGDLSALKMKRILKELTQLLQSLKVNGNI